MEMRRTLFPMRRTKLPDIQALEAAIFDSVQGLLVEQTRKICEKSGLPYDEMRAQADYIFCYALRRFDEDRGVKFSSFLYSTVHNGLVNYGRLLRTQEGQLLGKRLLPTEEMNEAGMDPVDFIEDEAAGRYTNLLDELLSLSPDARELAELVLLGFSHSLDHLYKLAKKRIGWTNFESRYARACEELKQVVMAWD